MIILALLWLQMPIFASDLLEMSVTEIHDYETENYEIENLEEAVLIIETRIFPLSFECDLEIVQIKVRWEGKYVLSLNSDTKIINIKDEQYRSANQTLNFSDKRVMKLYVEPLYIKTNIPNFISGESDISEILPGMKFVEIHGDTFQMGSPSDEQNRSSNETLSQVELSSFQMMTTEVTQKMWKIIMANYPSQTQGDSHPVVHVTWNDCQQFISNLNYYDPGKRYRLPLEAEWEYACRAGTSTAFSTGRILSSTQSNINGPHTYPKIHEDTEKSVYRGKTTPVGSFHANQWGLYDMHGNVSEWCFDESDELGCESTYTPKGPYFRSIAVIRGGNWMYGSQMARSATRGGISANISMPNVGFRLVRDSK